MTHDPKALERYRQALVKKSQAEDRFRSARQHCDASRARYDLECCAKELEAATLALEGGPRCTHAECHVQAVRIVGYRDASGHLRRGYTCGNHTSDRPRGAR